MSSLFGTTDSPVDTPPDGGSWTYVRVAVERGMDRAGAGDIGEGLTYKSPTPLEVGRRVEVPLGRGKVGAKPTAGIVIAAGGDELLSGFPAHKVKAILRDTGAGLPPNLVELAKWIASYYASPLGMVLASMLPAAVKKRTGLRLIEQVERVPDAEASEIISREQPTKAVLTTWASISANTSIPWPTTREHLAAKLDPPAKTLAPINRLIKLGLLKTIEVEDVRQQGGVETQMGIEQADPLGALGTLPESSRPKLTPEQHTVVEGISAHLTGFSVHLIRGVTGSGKTEVYLRVLERVLAEGKSAIVLVPEISLTPQTAGRFVERFRSAGVGVAVLHSGLSASQRHKEWTRLASGAARIVVGARSAVFAPIDTPQFPLGLIVVDEEHAGDYKQDQLPRYHGRDVAIKRAHMAACPVVLGSATPSLESWMNAQSEARAQARAPQAPDTQSPPPKPSVSKYTLWELTQRATGGQLPRVEIVDLNDERKLRVRLSPKPTKRTFEQHHLGPTLETALHETLTAGGQALLLLNRRGYASYIACPDSNCGWIMVCDDCDAKMVQHRVIAGQTPPKGVVRCHHCLAQKLLPELCPVCNKRVITLGLGTQSVEFELARKFAALLGGSSDEPTESTEAPNLPGLLRVDGDTMGSARDYFDALKRFASGEVKILVGTQMISKGLDFPNVRLVGVINADTALSLPDFRAAERTFQLVSQVAGRAGRGSIPGRVIVQTFDPSAPAITFAAEHDYVGFASEELAVRREAGLPPTVRMARIVLRDLDLHKAQAMAETLAGTLRAAIAKRGVTERQIRIIGPMLAPISRIAGHHRFAIEIMSSARMLIQDILADARAQGLCKSDAHTAIDVDPIALM